MIIGIVWLQFTNVSLVDIHERRRRGGLLLSFGWLRRLSLGRREENGAQSNTEHSNKNSNSLRCRQADVGVSSPAPSPLNAYMFMFFCL